MEPETPTQSLAYVGISLLAVAGVLGLLLAFFAAAVRLAKWADVRE